MKGRIIAGLLAFALGFSGCGSTETVFTQTTVETAVSSMSTSAETTINFTPTISTTQPTETITETTAKPEQSELKNLDEIIKDVEARNEYFEVADSKKINLNNDSFDDVIVLSLIYTEVNFSYYVFDGKTYTLLNDVKIMRAFNFDKQIFEFGSIPGEIENLIIKDFEYGGERIKTIVFSRHFYFEQLNYIAEIIIDSENEFYIKPLFCFGIVVEETATGTLYAPRYYEFIDGERAELTASEFYLLTSEYLGDEEIAFSTDPEFAFEPDSVNIRGYKIPLDCEEFAIINPDMSGRPIIENTIEISGNITDEDITAISKLKNLRTLGLMNVGLTDISFLNSNKNLEKIYLDYNDITDIKLFSNFSHLNQLSLSYNPIKDISSLSKLASLGYLDVSFTDINSISDLPENLISLFIQNVDIKSFDEIGRLKKLKILNICGNKIDDISFLKNLSELEDLYAANNAITDIGALENKDLKIIHMTENEIEDFSVISGLNSPTELWMDFTDTDAVYFKKLFPECIILNYSSQKTTSDVVEKEDFSDINKLFDALIEKSEFIWGIGVNEEGYNYLIEKIDIDDYEVLEEVRTDPFYERLYRIRVNVSRSDAPEFPVGERVWIYSTHEPNILRDSENIRDYLWEIYYVDDVRLKIAAYFSMSFNCYETADVDSFLKLLAEEHGFINESYTEIYWGSVVHDAMQFTYVADRFLTDPPQSEPNGSDGMSVTYTAKSMNKALHDSLVTDIDLNIYCTEISDQVWMDWESSGFNGTYIITDDYVEITYYGDWHHIIPAKKIRYFFDEGETPRLERLEMVEDYGYEPCRTNSVM